MNDSGGPRLGLGPVFTYEWITSSRRWQGYVLRSVFVLVLLVSLVVIWMSRTEVQNPNIRQLAHVGEMFYMAAIGTQLTLVLLVAPAATAGAICIDRARGTLTHLLVTDLSDSEIVIGKLAARLVPVVGLVACALPVTALLTLLGGVDPDALLGAFMVTLGVAALGCCLALLLSLWAGKTHEALLGTYSVWGLWLLATPMINQLNRTLGWSLIAPSRLADPYNLSFAPYWTPGSVSLTDYLVFLAVTLAISCVLATVAVLRLRPVCTREKVRTPRARSQRFPATHAAIARLQELARRLPGPSLDFNPVLWREWHRSRPSRWARIVVGLYIGLATVFSIVAIVSGGRNEVAAWVNGMQVSIGLLFLSVSAATSLAEERVRGSLDVLMATPLSTRAIVFGKWLGTFRLVPPMAILPGLVIIGTDGPPLTHLLGAVFVATFVLCSGAAVTSLGLAMATWVSRLGRAVSLTVTCYVVITVGWLFVVMMFRMRGPDGDGMMMGSPFFWAGEISFELCGGATREMHLGWGVVWIAVYAAAAMALLGATLATFNRCLGRVETGIPVLDRARLGPVVLVPVGRVMAEPSEVA